MTRLTHAWQQSSVDTPQLQPSIPQIQAPPAHGTPLDPPARLLLFVPWEVGGACGGEGATCWGQSSAPLSPRAVLTARSCGLCRKALCSAISHPASEHAARLFPGEQRRQLLPSCSTSLPHRLLAPDAGGGEQKTPPRASHPCPRLGNPSKGWGAARSRKAGTSTAVVRESRFVRGWIRPIPAPSSASRCPSSRDPTPPGPGQTPPGPLFQGRSLRRSVGGLCRAWVTPTLRLVVPWQEGAPGTPATPQPSPSLRSQRCWEAAAPHFSPPALRAPGR